MSDLGITHLKSQGKKVLVKEHNTMYKQSWLNAIIRRIIPVLGLAVMISNGASALAQERTLRESLYKLTENYNAHLVNAENRTDRLNALEQESKAIKELRVGEKLSNVDIRLNSQEWMLKGIITGVAANLLKDLFVSRKKND